MRNAYKREGSHNDVNVRNTEWNKIKQDCYRISQNNWAGWIVTKELEEAALLSLFDCETLFIAEYM